MEIIAIPMFSVPNCSFSFNDASICSLSFVQIIDPDSDELPQRAKYTIVATACLLLIMCLLLVGITLRMAPLIDDMGECSLFNHFHGSGSSTRNSIDNNVDQNCDGNNVKGLISVSSN